MTDTRCNGWRNAATWTVNLWFGDEWSAMAENGIEITADTCRDDVERYVEELIGTPQPANNFVWDMLDLRCVDWDELAEHHAPIEIVEG